MVVMFLSRNYVNQTSVSLTPRWRLTVTWSWALILLSQCSNMLASALVKAHNFVKSQVSMSNLLIYKMEGIFGAWKKLMNTNAIDLSCPNIFALQDFTWQRYSFTVLSYHQVQTHIAGGQMCYNSICYHCFWNSQVSTPCRPILLHLVQ